MTELLDSLFFDTSRPEEVDITRLRQCPANTDGENDFAHGYRRRAQRFEGRKSDSRRVH